MKINKIFFFNKNSFKNEQKNKNKILQKINDRFKLQKLFLSSNNKNLKYSSNTLTEHKENFFLNI